MPNDGVDNTVLLHSLILYQVAKLQHGRVQRSGRILWVFDLQKFAFPFFIHTTLIPVSLRLLWENEKLGITIPNADF